MNIPKRPRTAGETTEVFAQLRTAFAEAEDTLSGYRVLTANAVWRAKMDAGLTPSAARMASEHVQEALVALVTTMAEARIQANRLAMEFEAIKSETRWQI